MVLRTGAALAASSLETVVSFVPTKKKEDTESHFGHRPSCAFRGNFFQASFLSHHPPPSSSPQKTVSKNSLLPSALFPIITVVGLRGTDVLKILMRNDTTAACQFLAHDAALRHNALEGT